MLDYKALDGLLVRGGTILGTANRGKFSAKTGHGETRQLPKELMDETKRGMEKLGISALVSVGGDGSLTIAQQMHEAGIPIVGVPKTIDNDLAATTITFGFDSAVACATDALDRLHTTAESHNRVMVLEVMGRYAGWIAIYAGVAGGADVILIPEIPFQLRELFATRSWNAKGKENILRWSLRPKARNRRAAICHQRRSTGKSRGAAGRHRRGGRGGNRKAHRQGNARDGARPFAARRQSHVHGPCALHVVRREGR